jgi:DNA primase
VIPDAVIDEIRDRVDVVAVIGRHMELKRSGRTWKGCCVFHGEKTPSFHVYPEDKHFKCYGCGVHGDVFGFLQRLEGKEFPEVVRDLAREVGVEIPEAEEESADQKRRRKERNEILAACDAAARYWTARLGSRYGAGARGYLEERGVSEESIRRFRLGVAADEWSDLAPRLKEKGVGQAALVRAGLLVEKEKGGGYDRFRNRLMFPIAAMDGQVIGFGGRALPGSGKDDKGAKYINTPETALYKKSKVLYGLDLARESIRRTRRAVLVEGYFDVIGLHQAGVGAVAVCGTALTPEHVELLARCDCREVTILFDGDSAGLAAPAKAAAALFPAGMAGKVAVLPAEAGRSDPDEFARANGKAAVEALLGSAVPLSEFLIDREVERSCGGRAREAALEAKLATVRELGPFVRLVPEGLARSVFEDSIARRLDLDAAALRAELSGERRERPPRPPAPLASGAAGPRPVARQRYPGVNSPWPRALGLLVTFPGARNEVAHSDLLELFPEGEFAELARKLIQETEAPERVAELLLGKLDRATADWVRQLPAVFSDQAAAREIRKMMAAERADRLREKLSVIERRVARGDQPPEISDEFGRLHRQLRDQLRLLSELDKSPSG